MHRVISYASNYPHCNELPYKYYIISFLTKSMPRMFLAGLRDNSRRHLEATRDKFNLSVANQLPLMTFRQGN